MSEQEGRLSFYTIITISHHLGSKDSIVSIGNSETDARRNALQKLHRCRPFIPAGSKFSVETKPTSELPRSI